MANFLDFDEIVDVGDLSGSSKIVGLKSDDSAEQQFSVDLLFEKFELSQSLSDSVTFKSLSLSGLSLTGAESTSSLSISSTWNTTGTPTAFKLDVTDTASDAASLLIDLRVGGVSRFSVSKSSVLKVASIELPVGSSRIYTPSIDVQGSVQFSNAGDTILSRAGAAIFQLGTNHATTPTAQTIKAHDVVTGVGADLVLKGGSGSTGQSSVWLCSNTSGGAFRAVGSGGVPFLYGCYSGNDRGYLSIGNGSGGDIVLESLSNDGDIILIPNGAGSSKLIKGVFTKGAYTPRISLTYSGTLTPNCNDGLSRSITMTGDQVINAPTNGVDGMVLKLKCLASGGARELTFHSAIKMPTGATYEATVASGATRIIELEYNGTAWMLIKNLEFAA